MQLWRISRHRDLSGMGGLRANGRWHHRGQPVVYLSENPASALLEVCVHTAGNDIPPEYTLLCVEAPETKIDSITPESLPDDWQIRFDTTRQLGTEWLRTNRTALLRIPSAIVPHTSNFLFNPLHPDAKAFQIVEAVNYPFDPRIKR
jgi:RES domain-containing protein